MFHRWVLWQMFAGKHLTDLTFDILMESYTAWLRRKGFISPFKFVYPKEY